MFLNGLLRVPALQTPTFCLLRSHETTAAVVMHIVMRNPLAESFWGWLSDLSSLSAFLARKTDGALLTSHTATFTFLEIHNLKALFLQNQLRPAESVHRISHSQQFGSGDPTAQPMRMERMACNKMGGGKSFSNASVHRELNWNSPPGKGKQFHLSH